MVRNKLYDEVEKEGYTFQRILVNGQSIPKVEHLDNPDDWAMVNTSMTINGQYQVSHGPAVSQTTVKILQRVLDETSKSDYYDYISKSLIESTSI